MLRACACLAAVLAVGCSPGTRTYVLDLRFHSAPECRPERVDAVEIRALGDFSAELVQVEMLAEPIRDASLTRFPPAVSMLSIGAHLADLWEGGGVLELGEQGLDARVQLLPFGVPCAQADPFARAPDGSAATVLATGELVVAGGPGTDGGRIRILALDRSLGERCRIAGVSAEDCDDIGIEGDPRGVADRCAARGLGEACDVLTGDDVIEVREGLLLNDRQGATLTGLPSGDALIAGGGVGGDTADNTFERLRLDPGAAPGLFEVGRLMEARRDHGAVLLPDGTVLLVGGRTSPSAPPSASAERVDAQAARSAAITGALPTPRVGPSALSLDDGQVIVLGGVDAAGEPVTVVERFADDGFSALASALPARRDAAFAALPGGRAAQIGGARADGVWSGDVDVLLAGVDRLVTLPALLPPLEEPAAVAVPDGRLLVTGQLAGEAVAYVVNVGVASAEPLDARLVARELVALPGGVIAELSANGIALRRLSLTTSLDQPPASFRPADPDDRARLALDAGRGRWTLHEGRLVSAAPEARFEVPALRFASFRAALTAQGPLELLLTREGRDPLAIAITDTRVAIGSCAIERALGARVEVTRTGSRIELRAEGAAIACSVVDLPERVGIAVRAELILGDGAPDLERSGSVSALELSRL